MWATDLYEGYNKQQINISSNVNLLYVLILYYYTDIPILCAVYQCEIVVPTVEHRGFIANIIDKLINFYHR